MNDKNLESEKSIKKIPKRRISINFVVDSDFYEQYRSFLKLKNIPGSIFVYLLIKRELDLFKEGKKGLI